MAMKFRGQRFTLNLSDTDDDDDTDDKPEIKPLPSLVRDIKERSLSKTASAPTHKPDNSSFPKHKTRLKSSPYKQNRELINKEATSDAPVILKISQDASLDAKRESSFYDRERQHIDQENQHILSLMTSEEIEEKRKQLFSQLDSSLIEKLLQRANLDDARGDTGVEQPGEKVERGNLDHIAEKARGKRETVSFLDGVPAQTPNGKLTNTRSVRFLEDEEEPKSPIGLQPASTLPNFTNNYPNIHFPTAPRLPDLDPSDPSFLENLHAKYFPKLPADPSKLAWMAPLPKQGSPVDQQSSYYPAQSSLAASALRFNFRGSILPPRIARAVPVTKGLHHHAEAPEAAGYTIPELALLSRSAYPAQRCIAYQTLGRLLYRLGRGEWGGVAGEICTGLWQCVAEERVISILKNASTLEGGHQSCKAYAIEAIWLWHKGGGKEC